MISKFVLISNSYLSEDFQLGEFQQELLVAQAVKKDGNLQVGSNAFDQPHLPYSETLVLHCHAGL